ncbi:MAG: hypothetical protein U1E73_09290 [Planctomycetota bacterium]|nr:hypothetical protein [Planctomycetota bacterium]
MDSVLEVGIDLVGIPSCGSQVIGLASVTAGQRSPRPMVASSQAAARHVARILGGGGHGRAA